MRPTATPMLQRAWRSIRGCTHPRILRPVPGLTSPSSRRRRKTSVERIALAHAPCGVCVKLSSMKQKGPRSNAREGRCCTKLSTRCNAARMTVAVLSLGTELLRGELDNSNASWLAEALSQRGLEGSELACVGDDRGQITATLERLAASDQVIVCTGGLGPTTDDPTTQAAADRLNVPPELDARSLEHIRERFARAGRQMSQSNEKQAWFPRGAEILDNPEGTAPGFAVTIGSSKAFFLPGVPHEMRVMFQASVEPRLDTG